MIREHHGDAPAVGDGDHPLRDRIAAAREQDLGPIDAEKPGEEPQNRLDALHCLFRVPGRLLASERDRNLAPTGVENPRAIFATNRLTNLVRLVQVADHFLETDIALKIQLGRAKRLAFETERGQALEHVHGGDGGTVGKIEDRVGR